MAPSSSFRIPAGAWARILLIGSTVLLAASAFPQMKASLSDIVGLKVAREGISIQAEGAFPIQFSEPAESWQSVDRTAMAETIFASKKDWNPSKIRFNRLAPGFTAFFAKGIRLRVASPDAPYLSWTEGSVGKDVPTPPSRCITLSYPSSQVPLCLGFMDQPCALQVSGEAGNWLVESPPGYSGWVRFSLPNGTTPMVTDSAATLGHLAQSVAEQTELRSGPDPDLLENEVLSDDQSITVTYKFSRGSIVVPPALQFAPLGGYPVRIQSEVIDIPVVTDQTPLEITKTAELSVRFPVKYLPGGRSLPMGQIDPTPLGTASSLDIPSVAELALANMIGARDRLAKTAAQATLDDYLAHVAFTDHEDDQKLPFKLDGTGIDLASAQAFLMQSIQVAEGGKGEANALLQSVLKRYDWTTGLLEATDPSVSERATALAALTAALCPETDFRLIAGQLQAGLSGRKGLAIWRVRRHYLPAVPREIEPLPGLRQAVFGLAGPRTAETAFGVSLYSPIRIIGDIPLYLTADWHLKWSEIENKPAVFTLKAPTEFTALAAANLTKLVLEIEEGVRFLYTPTVAGECDVELSFAHPPLVPPITVLPHYSE